MPSIFVDTITKSYLIQKFSEYYSNAKLDLPKGMSSREWAFVSIESIPEFVMKRHISFENEVELKGYMAKNPPLHVYHSSAYYVKPDAGTMDEKGWKGADLIFDIDADHLPKGGLSEAKRQIIRLYDLLESDFGARDMKIVFSGSRGYHIHVCDREFISLDSPERREIVDYLMMNGLLFEEVMDSGSQKLRISKCIVKSLEKVIRDGRANEVLGLRKRSIEKAEKIIQGNRDVIMSGDFRKFPESVKAKLHILFEECRRKLMICIDPPVTADVKRLIRLPGSLHGKTSLRAVPLTRDSIQDFRPLRDAVAFGDETVRVRVKSRVRFSLNDTEYRLKPGKHELPENAAVFLMCRNVALYGW